MLGATKTIVLTQDNINTNVLTSIDKNRTQIHNGNDFDFCVISSFYNSAWAYPIWYLLKPRSHYTSDNISLFVPSWALILYKIHVQK